MKISITPEIIQTFFKKLDGRDKTNKLIQYFFKLMIATFPGPMEEGTVRFRAKKMVTTFSLTRKVLRLGHSIESYADLKGAIKEYSKISNKLKK